MRFRLFAAVMILLIAGPAWAAQVVVSIDEHSQEMTVTIDGQQEYVWPVSTGVARHATPSGKYKPFRMEEFHFSEEWDDAPMPHSIFFTRLGHAIHGTEYVDKLGTRASHGCVRLDPDNAATLFALVQEVGLPNTTVVVTGTGVLARKAGKRINTTAVIAARAGEKINTVTVVKERVGNRKRQLWPYERAN